MHPHKDEIYGVIRCDEPDYSDDAIEYGHEDTRLASIAGLSDLIRIGHFLEIVGNSKSKWIQFAQIGGFAFVVDLMKTYPQELQIQSTACAVLIHILRLEPDVMTDASFAKRVAPTMKKSQGFAVRVPSEWLRALEQRLLQTGLIVVLLDALETFPDEYHVQAFGCIVLRRFLHHVLERGRGSRQREQESDLANRSVTAILVHTLAHGEGLSSIDRSGSKKNGASPTNLSSILKTIELMRFWVTHGFDVEEVLVGQGFLLFLAQQCGCDHPRVLLSFLELLVCVFDLMPLSRIRLLSLVPMIVRVIKYHMNDKLVLVVGCCALWSMAHGSEAAKLTITGMGGIHCMVRILLCHASSLSCALMSTGVLQSLAASTDAQVLRRLARASPKLWEVLLGARYLHSGSRVLTFRIETIFNLVFSALIDEAL
jgi:hypothetical protein